MKLNKETLKRIIKEEIESVIRESEDNSGTDFHNKLVTLMGTKEGVYQAEALYEYARDQLAPDEQSFLDNCFKFLEIAREARKLDSERKKIEKEKDAYLKENPYQPWEIKRRQNDVFLQELKDKIAKIGKEIRELNDLFDEQGEIVGDLVGRMSKDNPRVHAFYSSRQVATEEAGGLFGMRSI